MTIAEQLRSEGVNKPDFTKDEFITAVARSAWARKEKTETGPRGLRTFSKRDGKRLRGTTTATLSLTGSD